MIYGNIYKNSFEEMWKRNSVKSNGIYGQELDVRMYAELSQ